MKLIYKSLLLFLIIASSFYAGFENPEVVYKVRYFFTPIEKQKPPEKIDNSKNEINQDEFLKKEFEGNSFSVFLEKAISIDEKTASIFINSKEDKSLDLEIFTQKGFLIKKNSKQKLVLPVDFYAKNNFRNGGLKSIFKYDERLFAFISRGNDTCYYVSLIEMGSLREIVNSKCISKPNGIDFNGSGGAYIKLNDGILFTVGAPENSSTEIAKLSQNPNSIFGKILFISDKNFDNENEKKNYKIYSSGHRNPQGLVKINENIFSLEHGPQGGDELNQIKKNKNYGWPIVSLGTKYNNGASYKRNHKKLSFVEPLYSFIPSVAPSSLNQCPKNLEEFYNEFTCLLGLSLKGQSIIIILLDKLNSHVMSIEKIKVDKRLRHFGLTNDLKLFENNSNFYISADADGLYEVRFDKFR